MLDISQAKAALANMLPNAKVQDWILYKDLYLFRVAHAGSEERDYDPFFSVDTVTGWVQDFSVMHDGDISEISRLFAASQNKTSEGR